jgi:hypothetical protein
MQGNTYNFSSSGNNTGIWIDFKKLVTPISYNSFTVTKYACSPLNPVFEGNAPLLLINKVVFAKTVMTEFTGEVLLNLDDYANNIKLSEPKVFFRSTLDSGLFVEIPTAFEASSNTLKFTIYSEGEICIGGNFDNSKPGMTTLTSPKENSVLNKNKDIKFVWSPSGRYKSFKIIFGKLKEESQDSIIIDESTIATSYTYPTAELNVDDTYYWFVTATNEFGSVNTGKNTFMIKDSYINMQSPNGGEKLIRDSISYVVKWDDNLDDLVRIELMDGDAVVLKIADSLQSPLNNIKWTIPASVPVGTNYKIKVSGIGSNPMSTISQETFEITAKSTSVSNNYLKDFYEISVSPNPVVNMLNIGLVSDKNDTFEISVINLNGVELFSSLYEIAAGRNQFSLNISILNAGVYLVKFKSQKGIMTEKIIKAE